MPRPPNEKCATAEKLWRNGMKLVDIGKKLNIPASTVRRWKHDKNWDKTQKKENERSKNKKNVQNKGGAPKGNQNAKGNKGNQNPNTLKHGGYSQVYWDTLTEAEKEMIDTMDQDEEMLLIESIQLFAVRERRIMKAINKYIQDDKSNLAVESVVRVENKRTFKDEREEQLYNQRINEEIMEKKRLPGKAYQIQTNTTNKDNIVVRLEKELSTVQSKKTQAIKDLATLRLEEKKLSSMNDEKEKDIEVQIYLPDNGRNK